MYFILSKILLYLLFPLSWVFLLFIFFITSKKTRVKRRCVIAAILLLYVFSNSFLFNQFAKRWDITTAPLKPAYRYSCVIILGGFAGGTTKTGGRFNWASDRFIQGLELLKTQRATHILITSGNASLNPDSFREGTWVKTQLKAIGIPDSLVLIESNSRNTIENARFSNVLLKQSNLPGPYLLVTSAFHMRRASMIFKKEHINIVPYSCNFVTKQGNYAFDDYFIPSSDALTYWNIYIKEVVGYIVNYFNG